MAMRMSLRLWSDHLRLEPILDILGTKAHVLHVAGQPMADKGVLAKRIAPRNYAALAESRCDSSADLDAWLDTTLRLVGSSDRLAKLVKDREIEAVLWIATMGSVDFRHDQDPAIAESMTKRADAMGLGILLENYTADTDESPAKSWLSKLPAVETMRA